MPLKLHGADLRLVLLPGRPNEAQRMPITGADNLITAVGTLIDKE